MTHYFYSQTEVFLFILFQRYVSSIPVASVWWIVDTYRIDWIQTLIPIVIKVWIKHGSDTVGVSGNVQNDWTTKIDAVHEENVPSFVFKIILG